VQPDDPIRLELPPMATSNHTLRFRLRPVREIANGSFRNDEQRFAFWVAVTSEARNFPPIKPFEATADVERLVSGAERMFVDKFPSALADEIVSRPRRKSLRDRVGRRREPRIAVHPTSFKVQIVGYDSLIFDLSFIGAAARALAGDPAFVRALTAMFVPAAFANVFGTRPDSVWADLEGANRRKLHLTAIGPWRIILWYSPPFWLRCLGTSRSRLPLTSASTLSKPMRNYSPRNKP
jgi:hypothetical protein